MAQLKHLIRLACGWYESTSKKDRYYLEGVALPPHVAKRLIRKARCVQILADRKVYEV